ncbi:hypothetical protein ACJMK2_022294 [Sinanodonta woodiana]|uniref:Leucine zipper transcription factor-like protein 1 n=1 Tax=Sinanodonta woodiana TaxID=1069815 RepID=A0ABD3TKL1_SINWO
MSSNLGVNDHHQAQILNFIRFTRYQRDLRLRAVDFCFNELKETRLDESTYTIDEVMEMLDGLLMNVKGEIESELLNAAHTNVLLLRQMFLQAEKWHLKLSADISELENKELLDKIADFEEQQFAGTKRDTDFQSMLKNMKLIPLNETGGTALLHMKIDELQAENEALKAQLLGATSLAGELKRKQLMDEGSHTKSQSAVTGNDEVESLRRKMAGLQSDLETSHKYGANTAAVMEKDLTETKHELLRIREMLEMAEKELEKKVSQTAPFKNLKQMLVKKNEQMKDLRKRLQKYESVDDD